MAIITFNLQYLNMICLNCGNSYEGNFCPSCGQKAATKRLKFGEMVNNFLNSFVGGDNVFMNTSRDLVVRPGHMVRNYLLGKRVRYYNPLQMYVFMLTVYAVVSYVLGISESIFDDMTKLDFGNDEESKYASVEFIVTQISKLSSNKLYGTLTMSLFAVFPYRWFFRKCKIERPDGQKLALNKSEQFYVQMYDSCISLILSTLMLPLSLFSEWDDVLTTTYHIVTITYLVLLYCQLLGIKWWKSLILNAIALVLTFLSFLMLVMVISIIAGVVEGLMK